MSGGIIFRGLASNTRRRKPNNKRTSAIVLTFLSYIKPLCIVKTVQPQAVYVHSDEPRSNNYS